MNTAGRSTTSSMAFLRSSLLPRMLSRLRKAWPAALVAALALWLLFALWLRVPTVQRLEGWFWPLGDGKLLPSLLLGVALFSFPLVCPSNCG